MKDILSAFNTDVFRPIITLFVPGAIAISSWIVALFQVHPNLRAIAAQNRPETVVLIAVSTLFAAMIVEDWGSRLESDVLDKYRDRRTKGQFLKEWQEYLLVSYAAEPVARRYLGGLLVRLKFELDGSVALLLAGFGTFFVDLEGGWIMLHWVPIVFSLYLFFLEARSTHKLMGEVRHGILTGTVRIIGVRAAAV